MTASLRCINDACGADYSLNESFYRCSACGDLLEVRLEPTEQEPAELKRLFRERLLSRHPLDVSGVWRHRELLPFDSPVLSRVVTLGEGNTPLLAASHSAHYCGLKRLRIKHLGWNPSGSFKDLGMTTAISQAQNLGFTAVGCASTGNTAASLAAYASRASLKAVVFVPEGHIALGKLSQALDYGAITLQFKTDFDEVMELIQQVSKNSSLYLVNSINPFRIEGQKTAIVELMDQLDWKIPDRIVLPAGNLGNASAIGKGLRELARVGLIDAYPRLTLVQAAGSDPLAQMLRKGLTEPEPVIPARTLASAIKIGNPVSWKKAVRVLEELGGECLSTAEREIADGRAVLAKDGVGCEPASGVTVAGLRRLSREGGLDPDEDVVVLLTGHQLKDPDYIFDYHLGKLPDRMREAGLTVQGHLVFDYQNPPRRVAADPDSVLRLLAEVIPGFS